MLVLILISKLVTHRCSQARSQDLEKGGGGYFERVRSMQTTLTRIFIDLESVSDGLSEIWDEMSRKDRKFKGFFRPKLGDLQKKKKKRSSPKFRAIFSPNFASSNVWGGLFSYGGGAIFHFSQKIGLKSTKIMRFCILHKPMGGLEPPRPPPGYATGCSASSYLFSCHRTASDANYWTIRTLFIAMTTLCSCAWRNPLLLRSFQWSNIPVHFFEFLSTKFTVCSKPPSRDNHHKA